MRILLFSDSPIFESGMGRAIRNIGRVLSSKHDIAFLGWHQDSVSTVFNGTVPVYPCKKQTQEKIQREEVRLAETCFNAFQPHLIITLGDICDFMYMPDMYERYNFKWLPYFNIDSRPIRDVFLRNLTTTPFVMTTSIFGEETVKDKDPSIDVRPVYHGYDAEIFYPLEVERKLMESDGSIKKDFTGTFVVFMDSQNTKRKNYPSALRAYKKFAEDKKDVCLLMLTHPETDQSDNMSSYDLKYLIEEFDLQGKVLIYSNDIIKGEMLSDEQLNKLYNLVNVYLSTAQAEGFGLSVLQAMATNTIPVAPDYASYTELLSGNRGKLTKIGEFEVDPGTYRKLALVDTDDLVVNLEHLYQDWRYKGEEINKINQENRKFVQKYTWEKSVEKIEENIKEVFNHKKVIHYPKVPNLYRPKLRSITGRVLNKLNPAKESVGMVVMGGMGDNIQSIPILKGIARAHPDSKLVIICEGFSEIFSGIHPNCEIIEARRESFAAILKTICNQFDYFYDIRYVSRCYRKSNGYDYQSRGPIESYYEQWPWANNVIWKEGKHVVNMRLSTAELGDYASIDDMTYDKMFAVDLPTNEYAIVNNGAGGVGKLKKLSTETWPDIVNYLKEKFTVMQVGSNDDERIPYTVDLRGKTQLEQLAYLLKNSSLILCPEGGVYHLAKSIGKDCVVWFSVTNPEFFAYKDSIVFPCRNTKEFKCEPCWWKGSDYFHNRCMRGFEYCENIPTSEEIINKIEGCI